MTRQQKLIGAAVAVLVAFGVVGAAFMGGDGRSDPQVDAGPTPTTASAPGASAFEASGEGQSGHEAQAGRAGGSSAASSSAAPGSSQTAPAASGVNAWQVPAEGKYRYHTRRTGDGPFDWEGSLIVNDDGGGEYRESRVQQHTITTRFYAIGGGVLRQTKFALSGQTTSTCSWDRPLVIIDARHDEGHAWTTAAQCRLPLAAGDEADVRVEMSWKVVGVREAKVGEATVPLLRIDGTAKTLTTTRDGTIEKTSTVVNYFDTARGLLAQSTEDATETGRSGTTTYRIVETMLTTQPEAPKQ